MQSSYIKIVKGLLVAVLIVAGMGALEAQVKPPVNTGPEYQEKQAGLSVKSLLVGSAGAIAVDADGKLAVGVATTLPNIGNTAAGVPDARLYVGKLTTPFARDGIRVEGLAGKGLQTLCTSSSTSTDLKTCGAPQITLDTSYTSNAFHVPKGVTSITVEVYGGGGGYGADGQTSRFYGNGIDMIAYGGKAVPTLTRVTDTLGYSTWVQPQGSSTGGVGGKATGGSTNIAGSAGGNGSRATAGTCIGGNGGKNSASKGGTGGAGANPNINTNDPNSTGFNWKQLIAGTVYASHSSEWVHGKSGSNYGGGAGGSACLGTADSSFVGFGGAGAGGYAMRKITVKEGEVYHFVVGAGGSAGHEKGGDGAVLITF